MLNTGDINGKKVMWILTWISLNEYYVSLEDGKIDNEGNKAESNAGL